MNWNSDVIKQNSTMLHRLYRSLKELENIDAYKDNNEIDENIINGLYDDLNTPQVIANLNIMNNKLSSANEKI